MAGNQRKLCQYAGYGDLTNGDNPVCDINGDGLIDHCAEWHRRQPHTLINTGTAVDTGTILGIHWRAILPI